MNRPSNIHWRQLIHCLKYLKGTKQQGIHIDVNAEKQDLCLFTDADWGGDNSKRRSTSGYVILIGRNILLWKSVIQKSIAYSTEEAEFKAFAQAISDLKWCVGLMKELNFIVKHPINCYIDNQACLKSLTMKTIVEEANTMRYITTL